MSVAGGAARFIAVNQDERDAQAEETGAGIMGRRIRLGMSVKALAEQSHVDRGRLTALEKGDPTVRQSTIGAVVATLDRLEQEMGLEPPAGTSSGEMVEFHVGGNFGVDVVVKGPVRDLAALEESVARLIARMQKNAQDSD